MIRLELDGAWECRRGDQDTVFPARVPGCVHLDLLRCGKIAEPAWRDNESRQQWIAEADWVYSRVFHVDEELLRSDRVVLQCLGLDTLARVTVNGHEVLRADNMFRTWEVDVTGELFAGKNRIDVTFDSPVPLMQERQETFPLAADHVFDPRYRGRGWLRKMACSFGWEWAPKLVTCGIWRSIALLGIQHARWLEVGVRQEHHDGVVELHVSGGVERLGHGGLRVRIRVTQGDERVIATAIELEGDTLESTLTVTAPRLWWPNGLGDQPLYRVRAELVDADGRLLDAWHGRIGLRTLTLDRERDRWGQRFQFAVNGVPFFAKGAGWVPADGLLPRLDRSAYRRLLEPAAQAHMNMIRVWGGGSYEQDAFYDLCDELGLLVWQDAMFAGGAYPTFDEDFMANVEAEVVDAIRRLRHHPCLALWCGSNDLGAGFVSAEWSEQSMSVEDHERLFGELLADLVAEHDPERPYWPGRLCPEEREPLSENAPYAGSAACREAWFAAGIGAEHAGGAPRFLEGFGVPSFPDLRTLEACTLPEDRNVGSYVMEFHQRYPDSSRTMLGSLLDRFRLPHGLEHTVCVSQIAQAAAIQDVCEQARRQQPLIAGALYWQLNDTWPCASCSSIDAQGRWKALHYLARRFFAPLSVSVVADAAVHSMSIHVSNQRRQAAPVTCEWEISDVGGRVLGGGMEEAEIPAQESRCLRVVDCLRQVAERGDRTLLFWACLRHDGEIVSRCLQTFVPLKHLELTLPQVTVSVAEGDAPGSCAVSLSASAPALYVRLELIGREVYFSDNFLHLDGRRNSRVLLWADEPLGIDEVRACLRLSSLVDSYREPGTDA